jgi:hypothetical protein
MTVDVGGEVLVQERDGAAEGGASEDPLEVRSARMVVRAVQARARDDLDEAMEHGLVSGVHPDRDGGLFAITPEAPLADQDPHEEPRVPLGDGCYPLMTSESCYTVW